MAFCSELYASMFNFEPYKDGNNPKHFNGCDSQTLNYLKGNRLYDERRKNAFYDRIYAWLKSIVESLIGPVVIAIAPGHEANPNPTGFMHEIVGELLENLAGESNKKYSLFDGRCQLIRTKTVPKQSKTPGLRSEETHRGTIATTADNTGKVVLILDDVWTSGSTLGVCEEVMLTTNPKDIKLLAIGKTVS